MALIILSAEDTSKGYTAEVTVKPRFFLPGSNYYLTINAPAPRTGKRKFSLGTSGVTFETLLQLTANPEYTGIAQVTSLEFYDNGLEVKFLEGKNRPGSASSLVARTRYIPRKRFPSIQA